MGLKTWIRERERKRQQQHPSAMPIQPAKRSHKGSQIGLSILVALGAMTVGALVTGKICAYGSCTDLEPQRRKEEVPEVTLPQGTLDPSLIEQINGRAAPLPQVTTGEHLLAAPTNLVLYVVPNTCSATQCKVGARLVNNASQATEFRFYLEGGTPITRLATPSPPTPGAILDFGAPGTPTAVGTRFCVYAVAVDGTGNDSAPSNTVCFSLTPESSGDLA